MLAGAPGLPQIAETTGQVAIEQGRVGDSDERKPRPFHAGADDDDYFTAPSQSTSTVHLRQDEPDNDLEPDSDNDTGPEDSDEEEDVDTFGQTTMSKLNIPPTTPITNGRSPGGSSNSATSPPTRGSSSTRRSPGDTQPSPQGSSLSRRATSGPSRTTPSLVRRTTRSTVFAQPSSPSHSTPSLQLARGSSMTARDSLEDPLLRIDPTIQAQLLRGHYCRSEVQFVLQLESIANRLLVVPKLAVRTVNVLGLWAI